MTREKEVNGTGEANKHEYNRFTYVSAPVQLQLVRGNTDVGATLQLYYKNCLQGTHVKKITIENV
jgi:hypothetical protein